MRLMILAALAALSASPALAGGYPDLPTPAEAQHEYVLVLYKNCVTMHRAMYERDMDEAHLKEATDAACAALHKLVVQQ